MASLWIRSGLGWPERDNGVVVQLCQVGARFEALNEPVFMAPSEFFSIFLPPKQSHLNIVPYHETFPDWKLIQSASVVIFNDKQRLKHFTKSYIWSKKTRKAPNSLEKLSKLGFLGKSDCCRFGFTVTLGRSDCCRFGPKNRSAQNFRSGNTDSLK